MVNDISHIVWSLVVNHWRELIYIYLQSESDSNIYFLKKEDLINI